MTKTSARSRARARQPAQTGRPRLSAAARTRKVTVSLTPDRIAAIHGAVEAGRAASVSAYVSQAIDRHVESDTLTALLDAMDVELGPPSAEATAWADQAMARLDARPGRRR